MKKVLLALCAVAALIPVGLCVGKEDTKDAKTTRVLMVTGRNVPSHRWRETNPILRQHLEQAERFEVVVSEEPLVLESSALDSYDVIVLDYYNWKCPSITEKARENLLAFVKGGKGLVSFHFSCRAFEDWPEYRNLIGKVWIGGKSGHGPQGEFEVKVTDKEHFITQGVKDFKTNDELYAKLEGDAKVHVLIEADSDWSKKTEPLAWTLDYGKGRVFNLLLGHDVQACKNPAFARLFQRGTAWVARGEDSY
ncbi:MAG: ThuA domain-containing protein [Sedimentisphaerales bacterium]|nr:ThuA domain-containing protein [Sedimentisphaerales bacterium]